MYKSHHIDNNENLQIFGGNKAWNSSIFNQIHLVSKKNKLFAEQTNIYYAYTMPGSAC